VAAVAEIVAPSKTSNIFAPATLEEPVKVCKPVKELVAVVTGILAPAKVDAPVPPFASDNMPVI
jgi:hypothetical protein